MEQIEGPEFVRLAAQLDDAKRAEGVAKEHRIALEEAIVKATGFEKSEGQETYRGNSDEGYCTLTIKQPINTTVDGEAWVKLRRKLVPKHLARQVFKAKYSLDAKLARALQEVDKEAWAEVSSIVTRKPGKVSVDLTSVRLITKESPDGN